VISAGAVLDGRFRASRRGIGGGAAGRTQTAIAAARLKMGAYIWVCDRGASGGRRNESTTLSGSVGPRFPVLQESGFTSPNCSKTRQGPQYLRVEPQGHGVLLRSDSYRGIYGFYLSHLWGS